MNHRMHRRWLAILLAISPTASALESSSPQALPVSTRTTKPSCAKPLCHRLQPPADRVGSAEVPEQGPSSSGVSLVLGLGAGAFHAPRAEAAVELVNAELPEQVTAPPGSVVVDQGGVVGPLSESRRKSHLAGPSLSLGVSLAQPLLAAVTLDLGLEERFTSSALLPLDGGSFIAGVMDALLVVSHGGWPVALAVGPSLAVARLDLPGMDDGRLEEPIATPAIAALLRLDLAELEPTGALAGTVDLVGHYGRSLNYEGASYRDLQLTLSLEL